MADTPNEAPVAPEAKSEATPTNNNPEPAKEQEAPAAPDMHGFTSEQLADMQKFFQANGGYEKVKSKISNPTPAQVEDRKPVEPAQPEAPKEPEYKAPAGAVNRDEWFVKSYFESLADKKFNNISDYIYSGKVLTEMAELGIQYLLPNGAIDAEKVDKFLTMKSQTAPAKQTDVSPEASAAPTVDYIPVGDSVKSVEEARAIIMQDMQLKRSGQAGHPSVKMAEDFLRDSLSKTKK